MKPQIFVQNPLCDIFPDTLPSGGRTYALHMAQNEGEGFVIGIRSGDTPLTGLSAQIVCDPPRSLGKGSWEMGSISLIAREMQLSALITSNHFHTTGSKLSPGIFSFYSPSPCFQKPQHHSWCFFFSPPCIPFSRKSSQLCQNLTPWSKFGGFLPGPLQVGGCPLPPHKPPPRVFSTRQPGGPL